MKSAKNAVALKAETHSLFDEADIPAKSPSRIFLLQLGALREPDSACLGKLVGRRVMVLPVYELLKSMFLDYQADKRGGDRAIWRTHVQKLVHANQLTLLGPLEDIVAKKFDPKESGDEQKRSKLDRQVERFLCNVTNLFHPDQPNIVLFSYGDPRKLSFDAILRKKIKYGRFFTSELDLASYLWSHDLEKYNDDVKTDEAFETELRGLVTTILQSSAVQLSQDDRNKLAGELTSQVSRSMAHRLDELLNTLDVVDPVSKLVVPPGPRQLYSERQGELQELNAPRFLETVWGQYLDAGLLYTGHLKKVDPSLYNAIIYLARQTARGVAELQKREWEPKDTAELLFSKYRLVTEEQIERPPAGLERQIAIIQQAKSKQRKPLRIRLQEGIRSTFSETANLEKL